MRPTVMSLSQLSPGQLGRLDGAGLSPELGAEHADLLRAMGLRPNASVRLCRLGDPCIVQIGHTRGDSCRLGVARGIADRISVCLAPEIVGDVPARA